MFMNKLWKTAQNQHQIKVLLDYTAVNNAKFFNICAGCGTVS
jgi:hypothetical protein